MIRTGVGALAIAILVGPLAAQSVEMSKKNDYEYYVPELTGADQNCQDAIGAALGNQFEGVSAVVIDIPDPWTSMIVQGLGHIMYSAAHIRSDFGDTTATFICNYARADLKVHEIAFRFDGTGLAGHIRTGPLGEDVPLSERRRRFLVTQVQ